MHRTPLARFIDLSTLWTLCLLIWFYFLFYRMGALYPALILACACSAATLGLIWLIRLGLKRRRRDCGLTGENIVALCGVLALKRPPDALNELARWLEFRKKYIDCHIDRGVIFARKPYSAASSANSDARIIALISKYPGESVTADELLRAWHRIAAAGQSTAPESVPHAVIAATSDFSPRALELGRKLDIALISPEALAELMLKSLPLCADSHTSRHPFSALRAIIRRSNAGRFGAYALGMGIAGRVLGLPYFRAIGLLCALMWLICAAQPRPPRHDKWV